MLKNLLSGEEEVQNLPGSDKETIKKRQKRDEVRESNEQQWPSTKKYILLVKKCNLEEENPFFTRSATEKARERSGKKQ